ncbi:MAG: DinB family protein [Saprospiraceae bacterium]
MNISKPQSSEYPPFAQKYISKVDKNPLEILHDQIDWITNYIKDNNDRMDYKYGEDKWSIKEALIHMIDTEQILAYRTLRIGRNDKTPLAGFQQDNFIQDNDFTHITPWDILEEFTHQRRATISMVKNFTKTELAKTGVAGDNSISVRGLIYMMAGHIQHHIQLFEERYR